jgi:hypothetical protein
MSAQLHENQLEFEGAIITVTYYNDDFTYQKGNSTINNNTLADLSPELFTRVKAAVVDFKSKKEERDRLAREEEASRRAAERVMAVDRFNELVKTELAGISGIPHTLPGTESSSYSLYVAYFADEAKHIRIYTVSRETLQDHRVLWALEDEHYKKSLNAKAENVIRKVQEAFQLKNSSISAEERQTLAYNVFISECKCVVDMQWHPYPDYDRKRMHSSGHSTWGMKKVLDENTSIIFDLAYRNDSVTTTEAYTNANIVINGFRMKGLKTYIKLGTPSEVDNFINMISNSRYTEVD